MTPLREPRSSTARAQRLITIAVLVAFIVTSGAGAAFATHNSATNTRRGVSDNPEEESTSWHRFVLSLLDIIPKKDDKFKYYEGSRGTHIGLYINKERKAYFRAYQGIHAEGRLEQSGQFSDILDEASRRGFPVDLVSNHPPCHTGYEGESAAGGVGACELVIADLAREAQARGVLIRFIFTGGYTNTKPGNRHVFGNLVRRVTVDYGAQILVGRHRNGHVKLEAKRLAQALEVSGFFDPDGATSSEGPLMEVAAGTQQSGGIDFSSLELRYLGEPVEGGGFEYAFSADAGDGDAGLDVGLDVAEQQSDAFFVWLSLPTSDFWVNLNPDEPDRIVDEELGSTDVGRILLEADLQMKKTVAKLIHPDTDLGERFWNELETVGLREESCMSFRQWIVPEPATVYEDDDGIHILDAPLAVQLESDYFESQGVASSMSCPEQSKDVEEHNESTLRSLVLPRIEEAVNEAPEYADLRRVYLSRVAAEWYRKRSASQPGVYGGLIDSGDVTQWVSDGDWSPRDTFDDYVESVTEGEFNVTRERREGGYIREYIYVFGGVDFLNVVFDVVDRNDLQDEWPGLAETVRASFDRPAITDSGEVWLGSVRPLSDAELAERSASTAPGLRIDSVAIVTSLLALLTIGAVLAWCLHTVSKESRARQARGWPGQGWPDQRWPGR